jgi:hypothetical protein
MQFCPTDVSLSAAIVTKYRGDFRNFVRRPAPEVDVSDMAEPHTKFKHYSSTQVTRARRQQIERLIRDERNPASFARGRRARYAVLGRAPSVAASPVRAVCGCTCM